MGSVRRSSCLCASMTCSRPLRCAQTNSVAPSGETAMPSAPCKIWIVPMRWRDLVSITATASLVLKEANNLKNGWLNAIQCGEPPTSLRSTLSVAGSIASTALPRRVAELGRRPQRAAPVHHHRMRREIVAHIDGALEVFRREIDDRDAAVGILVL